MARRKAGKEIDDLEALKNKIMNVISHRVRTPLSIVKEGLSLILDEIPGQLNSKQRKIIGVAKENIDRLTRSIEEILETSCDNILKQTTEKGEHDEKEGLGS